MVREFKFFRGYVDDLSININWDTINRINDLTQLPTWTPGITYQPTWITNPGYIVPQPYTITTTPGSGTITLPYIYGTTTTSFLTTSNPSNNLSSEYGNSSPVSVLNAPSNTRPS